MQINILWVDFKGKNGKDHKVNRRKFKNKNFILWNFAILTIYEISEYIENYTNLNLRSVYGITKR